MRAPLLSLAAGSLAALAACADSTPTAPITRPELTPLASVTSVTEVTDSKSPWARIVEGKTGPGSLYAIYVPKADKMNGDVVYYAHGFRDFWTDIDLRDQDGLFDIRNRLGAMGFTVAYSSFSVNGFAVKDGAQRTHQLRGLVAAELGREPARSFIVGHSLGGGIGLYLAEKYPDQYDGAVLMCGMVGGSLLQTQWVGNVRALFDFFYPNRLPGGVLASPGVEVTQPMVLQAISVNPGLVLAMASTAEVPIPFVPVGSLTVGGSFASQTLVGSIIGALNFHSRGIDNVLDLTNGHSPFDNTAGYSFKALPETVLPAVVAEQFKPLVEAADRLVPTYTMHPSARNYLERHFTPTGELRIPVLTVHNLWDPGVPAFHQAVLLSAVQSAGATDKLHQRFVAPGNGHCKISPDQAVQAFGDLVQWISSGNKPAN